MPFYVRAPPFNKGDHTHDYVDSELDGVIVGEDGPSDGSGGDGGDGGNFPPEPYPIGQFVEVIDPTCHCIYSVAVIKCSNFNFFNYTACT